MKTVFINIIIILAIAGAYYIDFFGWFSSEVAIWSSAIMVIAVLLLALKILGNPWHKDE